MSTHLTVNLILCLDPESDRGLLRHQHYSTCSLPRSLSALNRFLVQSNYFRLIITKKLKSAEKLPRNNVDFFSSWNREKRMWKITYLLAYAFPRYTTPQKAVMGKQSGKSTVAAKGIRPKSHPGDFHLVIRSTWYWD